MYIMHNYTRPIPPPRILLCGFYGCGNLGDDALLTALLGTNQDTPIYDAVRRREEEADTHE